MSAEVTITLDKEYAHEASIGIVLLLQAETNAPVPVPEVKIGWRYCVLEVLLELIKSNKE